jgi:hypothetical protein
MNPYCPEIGIEMPLLYTASHTHRDRETGKSTCVLSPACVGTFSSTLYSLIPKYEWCYHFVFPKVKHTLKDKEYGDLETAEIWFGGISQNSKVLRGASSLLIF